MTRRTRVTTGPPGWLAGIGVALLAVAVIAISAAAVNHAARPSSVGTAAPVESFDLGVRPPSTTPTPTPEPSAAAATPGGMVSPRAGVIARADERVLVVGSVAMWRAIAGECGGAAPLLERSIDGGRTWQDVTPRYRDVTRIAGIDVTGGSDADIVVATGPECATQVLRSFTQGEFWDPAPEALATWSFVNPADASVVSSPSGAIPAPCPEARGVSSRNGAAAFVCAAAAYQFDSGKAWQALPVDNALGTATTDQGMLVAHLADACDGIAVSRVAAGAHAADPVGCLGAASPATPVALADTPEGVIVWAGDLLETIP